jgi:hypothetical protein
MSHDITSLHLLVPYQDLEIRTNCPFSHIGACWLPSNKGNTPDCPSARLSIKMTIRSPHHVDIVDIRRDKPDESLLQLMLKGLQPAKAEARQLPTLLLYDGIFELLQHPQELTMTQNMVSSFLSRSHI